MKVWLLTITGLLVFILISCLVQQKIETATNRLATHLNQVEQALDSHNWEIASVKLHSLEQKWREIKSFWALLLNHKEIDAIEQSLERSKKAILSKSLADAQIELGTLRYFIKHIPVKEEFSLTNIF